MTDLVTTLVTLIETRPELVALGATVAAFAATATAIIGSMNRRRLVQRRLKVDLPTPRRETAKVAEEPDPLAGIGIDDGGLSPAVATFLNQAANILKTSDAGKMKLARQRMIQAGFFSQHAVTVFFLARLVGAVVLPLAIIGGLGFAGFEPETTMLLMLALIGAIGGYLGPSMYVDKCAKAVLRQNRIAFPDFMDLMGVCANAGLSMEASLERVTSELIPMYPALGVNLQVLCLEVRAGRPMELALQTLADRVGVPEVRAFATLLQQSRELGSSLSDALRVFAEDMRHQRLAAAEEKAYALPAKLSVPVTACILPVVLFIAIWPVVVKFNS